MRCANQVGVLGVCWLLRVRLDGDHAIRGGCYVIDRAAMVAEEG